jgi:iron complex outermembrane recepter protein
MKRQALALCGVSATAILMAAGAAQAQTSVIDELVVTAQKREESINDVPMSITAASGQTLKDLGVSDTAQLVKAVPGFNYTPSFYGTPVYSIRGVGFHDTSLAASPTVSVYLDEAPLPYSIMTQGTSFDLERVEVLKGPQGTLFGQNATGGAINYVAVKPSDTYEAGIDATVSRFKTIDVQGYVSGPISETLSMRFALRSLRSGNWQRSYTRDEGVGKQDFLNGRLTVAWEPSETFRGLLTLNAWRDRGETQMGQLFGFAPLNPVNGVDPRILAYRFAPKNARAADWGKCVNTSPFDPPFDQTQPPYGYSPPRPLNSTICTDFKKNNTYYSGSLRLDYDLNEDMTLTSLTSYGRFDRDQPIEGDGMIYQDYESLQRGHISTVSQELRVSGTVGGRGSWIVGGNYQHDETWDNFLQTYGGSSAIPVFGIRLGPTRPSNDQTTKQWAIFGNVDYPLSDTITLQGGLRYTENRKDFIGCGNDGGDGTWSFISQNIQNFLALVNGFPVGRGVNPGPNACATTGPPPTYNPRSFNDELNENNLSWRAGVNYRPNNDTLLYANISQGYKAGSFPTVATSAFSQLRPAVQESLLAYETGFKAGLADGRLQLNGAVFYYDYEDKQILGALNDPIFGALPALVNVPKSHVKGFELNGVWEPVSGLSIRPAVSYSASKIEGDYFNFDAFAQLANFGGQPFPNAPKWQANVDTQYTWAAREDVEAYVGMNINHQSFTRSFFYNTAPTSVQPPSVLDIPAYTLIDLRAGIKSGALGAQVWIRNLADKYYWQSAVHVNDVLLHYAGQPRTFGLTVTYKYQ